MKRATIECPSQPESNACFIKGKSLSLSSDTVLPSVLILFDARLDRMARGHLLGRNLLVKKITNIQWEASGSGRLFLWQSRWSLKQLKHSNYVRLSHKTFLLRGRWWKNVHLRRLKSGDKQCLICPFFSTFRSFSTLPHCLSLWIDWYGLLFASF